MKLSYFYEQAIKFGAACDPRKNKAAIKFYPDTAILYGSPDTRIKRVMVGIDIEAAELLLAERIRAAGGLDLVLAHHPEGRAYASLYKVMELQADLLRKIGLSEKVARELLEERMLEVERKVLPQNHNRPVDAARLLDMPFMCVHTPADNQVFDFMHKLMLQKRPKKVQDIIDILCGIAEYKEAQNSSSGPRILLGSPRRPVGKILVEMTGGTEGSKDVFDKLYRVGVRTLLSMHLSEEHLKKVKDANLNVVIAGHISSDTLGLNLLLDRIENAAGETLQVINSSGFIRFKRN